MCEKFCVLPGENVIGTGAPYAARASSPTKTKSEPDGWINVSNTSAPNAGSAPLDAPDLVLENPNRCTSSWSITETASTRSDGTVAVREKGLGSNQSVPKLPPAMSLSPVHL
jgi:hypothetical protein